MRIPLYKELQEQLNTFQHQNDCNTGLWYNKFCHMWNGNWELKNEKINWIKTVTMRKIGDGKKIADSVWRILNLIHQLQGETRFYKTEWRFVTGLGLEHPVENGFAWHHTLGVPYLPGSSVKGMVRAWVGSGFNPEKADQTDISRIFGDSGAIQRCVGSVIFFDALPTAPVQLEADVMTPHYSLYYRKEKGAVPADWHSPDPIPFLTVAAGETFVFAVAPRNPKSEQHRGDLQLVLSWLDEALGYLGAGAKTAAGYGRFIRDDETEKHYLSQLKKKILAEQQERERQIAQQQRERLLASMSDIRREMEEDGYSTEEFIHPLGKKWLERMEHADTSPEDQQEIARLLAEWYQQFKQKDWEKPKAKSKNAAKIQRIKAVLKE